MRRQIAVRPIGRSVAALAILATIGCAKGDQGRPKETAAAAPPAVGGARSLPGTLAKPLDQYSGDDLYALTRQLQFAGGVDRARRCRGQTACRGANPAARTSIRVDAVVGQDSLNPAALPPTGVIAARAINRGQLADTMYNMRPGAVYENYLIVLPAPGGATASWRLEELVTTTGGRTHRTIATGVFRGCNHQFVSGPRADFKTCAQAAQTRPASFGAALQGEIEPPIWVGCIAGCCTSDPPDGRS